MKRNIARISIYKYNIHFGEISEKRLDIFFTKFIYSHILAVVLVIVTKIKIHKFCNYMYILYLLKQGFLLIQL